MKKTILIILLTFFISFCFAGPLTNLTSNRYRGSLNVKGMNYELYIVNSDTTLIGSFIIHAKITDQNGNVTWITGMGNGTNSVKTLKLSKMNRWGVFENQNTEANHDGFDTFFLTKNLNKGSNEDVLKALHLISDEIKMISLKESTYEAQTEYGPLQLKMLTRLEQ